MPRRFFKDVHGDVDPALVGFSNKLAEVDLSEPEYTHRHPITGELCACHYGAPKQQERTAKIAAEEAPNVYLVSPSEDNYELLKKALESKGYNVIGENQTVRDPEEVERTDAAVIEGRRALVENLYEEGVPVVEFDGWTEYASDPTKMAEQLAEKVDTSISEGYAPNLKTDVGRRLYKQNQKIFRPDGPLSKIEGGNKFTGPRTLELIDQYADRLHVPELLPWLAAAIKKGEIKPKKNNLSGGLQLVSENHGDAGNWLRKIADWFGARQSPYRQGKNISEMGLDEVLGLAEQHAEWAHSKEMLRKYAKEIQGEEVRKREQDAMNPEQPLSERLVVDMPAAVEEINRKLADGEVDKEDIDYVLERISLNPEDYKGWKVVRIQDAQDAEMETAVLRHCIGSEEQPYRDAIDRGGVAAFSLRDENGIPKVSFHFNPEEGFNGATLAHIQGRSGYPKEPLRDLISLYNIAAGNDDDNGGEGDEESLADYGYGYQGEQYWNLGEMETIDEALNAYNDPYEMAYNQDAQLAEDAEITAEVNADAIVEEFVNDLDGWSDDLIHHFTKESPWLFDLDFQKFIEGVIDALKDKWIENYYGEYYDLDEIDEPPPFDLNALAKMVELEDINPLLLEFLKSMIPPGKPQTFENVDVKGITQVQAPNVMTAPSESRSDYAQIDGTTDMLGRPRPPMEELERSDQIWQDLEERGIVQTTDEWRENKPDPRYVVNAPNNWPAPFELDPTQPVQTLHGDKTVGELNPERPYGIQIPPRDNPALIAEEYYRIMNTEGQQAANDWYYKNYPNAEPSSQQLTSSWNDLMRW